MDARDNLDRQVTIDFFLFGNNTFGERIID